MNARNCPACQRELPEATLRALEQGTTCPHCATRLKRTPRRAPAGASGDNDYAGFQVSHTPPVRARPSDEDSYGWFQTKGAAGTAAPAAVTSPPPPARSLFPSVTAGSPLRSMPSVTGAPGPVRAEPVTTKPAQAPATVNAAPVVTSATPPAVDKRPAAPEKRPVPLALPPPAPPVEPRRAPTLVGAGPPPGERPAPVPPTPAPPVHPPVVRSAQVEPPRAALAMTAVVPTAGATLALAAPPMAFSFRSRRNVAIAAGAAMTTLLVAIAVFHRSADRRAAISAPLATLHDTSRASAAIQPARPTEAEPSGAGARAELGAEAAAGSATAAPHAKVRTTHRATAHQRRYAKNGKRGKHARHEKRSARQTEITSRATPSSGNDGEARASYERGNALLFAGDAAGAVAAYRKAVDLAPADPIGYRGLGLAYEQQGGTAAAIRALRKYLKLAPGAADREIISRRIARLGHATSRP